VEGVHGLNSDMLCFDGVNKLLAKEGEEDDDDNRVDC